MPVTGSNNELKSGRENFFHPKETVLKSTVQDTGLTDFDKKNSTTKSEKKFKKNFFSGADWLHFESFSKNTLGLFQYFFQNTYFKILFQKLYL